MTECPKCNGRGTVGYFHIDHFVDIECKRCNGSGEVSEVEMTNEEWLHSLNTEQLAEYLADKFNEVVDFVLHEVDENAEDIEPDDYWYRQDVIVEWLKQPHTPKE